MDEADDDDHVDPGDVDEEAYQVASVSKKRVDSNGVVSYLVRWEGYGPDEDMWKLATDLDRRGPVQEFEKEQLAQRADDDYEADKPKKAAPKAPPVVKAGPPAGGPVGPPGEAAADDSTATRAAALPSPATAKGARKTLDKTQKKSAPNRASPSPSSAKKNKV